MNDPATASVHERWSHLRFAVIGSLLAAPPARGALRAALRELAQRTWRHPVTGEPVQFGLSTIERWLSAEQIVRRSEVVRGTQDPWTIKKIVAARTLVQSA